MKYILLISIISLIFSYPIFPTILTVSIPYKNKKTEGRVENTFVRFLQASGADLIVVHTWTDLKNIDRLLENKVTGVIFQGIDTIDKTIDPYINILKYIQSKVISIYNSSKGKKKIPILALGNDMTILGILSSNKNDFSISKVIVGPNKIKFNNDGKKSWIFSDLQKSDFNSLENENICSNYITNLIPKNLFDNKLKNYFKIISTSLYENEEYVSIMESNLYPIIGMSFHPEHIVFEENKMFNVPESLEAIKTARFIGNSFVNYGRVNSYNEMTIEEKKDNRGLFDFIDPYGNFPEFVEGRYQYLFKKK
jgi:hypothetical protein